jgi:hypothetical protein
VEYVRARDRVCLARVPDLCGHVARTDAKIEKLKEEEEAGKEAKREYKRQKKEEAKEKAKEVRRRCVLFRIKRVLSHSIR